MNDNFITVVENTAQDHPHMQTHVTKCILGDIKPCRHTQMSSPSLITIGYKRRHAHTYPDLKAVALRAQRTACQ